MNEQTYELQSFISIKHYILFINQLQKNIEQVEKRI